MPIDKDEVKDDAEVSLARAMWDVVFIIVGFVLLAFVAGIWVHFIVEFFARGWEVVG